MKERQCFIRKTRHLIACGHFYLDMLDQPLLKNYAVGIGLPKHAYAFLENE